MFIQTEATPNPATMKFLPGRPVLENGTLDLRDAAQAEQSPLAEQLFGIPGVSGVFFGSDFITVTKSAGEWQQLKPMILGAVMEHFMSGAPLLNTGAPEIKDGDEFFDEADATTVATIKELLETRVRPAVANDGGDITFRGFRDGIVYLNMKGACSGCPSSTATLRHGIQNLLRHFIPDVTEVRPMWPARGAPAINLVSTWRFMRVLAIDTALVACAAAVLDTGHGIVASESLPMLRGHAEETAY